MLRLLGGWPRPAWGILALLAALAGAYGLGGRHAADRAALKERETYHDTLQRIDRAVGRAGGGDAGAARQRLRDALGPGPGDL